ncbi:MAG: sulfurtransferase complex subunit TusB [Burkholderiales bacterium]|mgnify:CR=1 FL=1|nr:sulfurtransferase complex subunit TusB [Zoogloeaceae bacterium]MBP9653050.1 sulfurtransferase complex subunit TusB [Rhodocyclaceae bacterium]MCZ2418329.1 sulfurtransferase complex subunit TusB [Burkholderiales bacterium]HNQ57707.1 sulfurtransferase complex subunit TusB [Candidatus Desulfobacillus denitrificans]MBV6409824.1 Protein TusB [Rhodocyclaceae bacterium]
MLHIVNKSPLDRNALDTCLATAQPGGALLLIEDGVYAATSGAAAADKLKQAMGRLKVYALKPDLEARGMADRALEGVTLVDYGGFVDLVTEHATCQSWL